MVLESLMKAKLAEKRPWDVFYLGILYASVAIFLSLWIFRDQTSLVMVFLTVMAAVPFMYRIIVYEEKKDNKYKTESRLLKEHSKALIALMFLFLGMTVSFTAWYIFLPNNMVESVFNTQISTIKMINSKVLSVSLNSHAINTSFADPSTVFTQIFNNNLKVLLFCIFFSFFFGAGAIFILTWNASVIATAIGTFIRNSLSETASLVGLPKVAAYFHIFSIGFLRYAIHGVPEILGYFIGALAGGIISVAVIKHDFGTQSFRRIIYDSLDLVLIAIFVLFIAAFLEVFVTPIFF